MIYIVLFFLGCQVESSSKPIGLEMLIMSGMYLIVGIYLGLKFDRIKETFSKVNIIRINKLKKEEV
jgi:hypothetical protein